MKGIFLLLSSVLLSAVQASPVEKRSIFGPKCHAMTSSFCGSIGYNKTSISTSDGDLVESVLQSFQPLVDSGCSEELKPFLCFAHLPICLESAKGTEPNVVITPCRSMCERVESKCSLLLKAAGLNWPETLKCSQYNEEPCSSIPTPQPTPKTCVCETCKVTRKPSVAFSKMCKSKCPENRLYAQIKVLNQTVSGDAETVFYYAQVEKTVESNADVKVDDGTNIWIISSSTKQCDCHQLQNDTTYVVELKAQNAYGIKPLYILGEDAVVMRRKRSSRFLARLAKCS